MVMTPSGATTPLRDFLLPAQCVVAHVAVESQSLTAAYRVLVSRAETKRGVNCENPG